MKFLVTATVVLILVLLCDGCEYHRRLEEQRRLAAERLRERGRAALTSAQNQAVEDVRHSIYGGGSHHSDHGSSPSTSGRSRAVYPVPSQTNLPAGSKYCGETNSTTYYCDQKATCIHGENGVWKCQYETSHTVSRYEHVPIVTRTGGSRTNTGHRTQYRPQSRGNIQHTLHTSYRPQSSGNVRRTQHISYRPQYGDNIRRTYTNTCPSGYERVNITSTRFKCVDIDECTTESNECEHVCKNTRGSFYCTCETGYTINERTECVDRNECEYFRDVCGPVGVCSNVEGSYTCECIEGYQKNDRDICEEINECTEDDPCAEGEICFNTWGSYECDLPAPCPEGYVRSSTSVITDQNCMRETPDDQYVRETIGFRKIVVEARKRAYDTRPLGTMTFSSTNGGYNHYFTVSIEEGRENFGYTKRSTRAGRLDIDFWNRKALEANINLPLTIRIIDRMIPKRLPYRSYGYGNQGSRQMSTKHEIVMEILPMVHGTAEDS